MSETRWGFDEYDIALQGLISHHLSIVGGTVERRSVPFRYTWPAELDLMAELAGMRLLERWGGWHRGPFTSDSRKHISVWEKPAEWPPASGASGRRGPCSADERAVVLNLPDAVPWPRSVPRRGRHPLLAPPGLLFYAATGIAVLIGLDANSRTSLSMLLVTLLVWGILAIAWLWLFIAAVWAERGRLSRRHWIRWTAIPLVLGLVFALTRYNIPFDARLAASRGAMGQAAAEIMAGGSTDRGWIGLYPVQQVAKTPNGIRFIIDDSGLGTIGFAYASSGQPKSPTDDASYDGTYCCDSYEPLGGGWWIWSQEWD